MGIFDALTTAVSGLQAQSFALQNISGNIANASTVGYKGTDTTFEDLVASATTPSAQAAGGVAAYAQQTITTGGTVSASTVATNMAINGDGFFSVQAPTSTVDNQPVFSGVTDYTRAGNFQVNANGYLVNGAGYYLMGTAVDPKTGNPLGSVPTVLNFSNNFVPAQATTAIQYAANLPTVPVTTASPTATAKTITAAGGLNTADFGLNNPVVALTPAVPYASSAVTGNVATDENGTAITASTLLAGTGSSTVSVLSSPFTTSSTITVKTTANGTTTTNTIAFIDTTATPPVNAPTPAAADTTYLDLGGTPAPTVATLLSTIDTITGNTSTPSSVTGGAITLNTGTANDFTISSTSGGYGALGLPSPESATRTGGGYPGTGIVTGADVTTFDNESISGGAVTVYNSAGTPVNVQLRWAMTDSASLGNGHTNTWNLFYQTSTTPTSTGAAWVNAGTNFVFNSNGNLTSPSGSGITIPNVQVNGQVLGPLQLNMSSGALTQFASTGGTATIGTVSQNGFAAGQLQSVAVNNNGIVVGTFSNGQNIDLAAVTLSHFNGTNYLQALSGEAYAVTQQSGPAIAGASGTISGSSLEGSNTDIADQFTKLIVTQQAYSANTKVITTANDMVQSLLAVIR
jgi:flagellar hook protein FlgE